MFSKQSSSIEEKISDEKKVFQHKEHIIQNSLRGKLKSNKILCEKCGNKLSKEIDSDFIDLFSVITEQLKDRLIQKDHGKNNNAKALDGYLLYGEKYESKLDITFKNNKVTPKKPFYEFKGNKTIEIYANKNTAKKYENVVKKELTKNGDNPSFYTIKYIENISDKGILGLFFSEKVENFNQKFYLGINKIAVGFASNHGITRSDLVRALDIEKEQIIYTKNIFPFFPISSFDLNLELNRLQIEQDYPTHTLILFTQRKAEGKCVLYCYVELFSTFQHYVILNDNYQGEDIYKTYYQTTLKQEIPQINVKSIKPKFIKFLIEEIGIEKSQLTGKDLNEIYTIVEQKYKNLKLNSVLSLEDMLEEAANQLMISFDLSQQNFDVVSPYTEIVDSFRNRDIHILSFLSEVRDYINREIQGFRRFFYENDGSGGTEIMSTPNEIITELRKNDAASKAYGHLKFQQLSQFIYNRD